jgi:selenocysteine-specific elongation factor
VKACQEAIGEEVFTALLEQDRLRQASSEVVFLRETDERMEAEIREMLRQKGTTTVAEVRDHFGTSRKYAVAYLEHLDAAGVTRRVGDARQLRNPPSP